MAASWLISNETFFKLQVTYCVASQGFFHNLGRPLRLSNGAKGRLLVAFSDGGRSKYPEEKGNGELWTGQSFCFGQEWYKFMCRRSKRRFSTFVPNWEGRTKQTSARNGKTNVRVGRLFGKFFFLLLTFITVRLGLLFLQLRVTTVSMNFKGRTLEGDDYGSFYVSVTRYTPGSWWDKVCWKSFQCLLHL